mgnify:CR=1 FL=1
MPKYWLCILTPENYKTVKEKLVWAVKDRHKNVIAQVKPGDKLVMYVIGEKKIKGIYEVTSELYREETEIFWDGIFPNRVRIKPLKLNDEGIDIKELVPELKLFKRTDAKWAEILRGRAMIELNAEDCERIKRKI